MFDETLALQNENIGAGRCMKTCSNWDIGVWFIWEFRDCAQKIFMSCLLKSGELFPQKFGE